VDITERTRRTPGGAIELSAHWPRNYAD